MRLEGMDELDLNGVLFIQFPDNMPLAESREMLELMVSEAYEEHYEGVPEDERPEMVMSPYWIYIALCSAGWKEFARMSDVAKKRVVADALERRKERFKR